jgi:hypothetical protein
MRRPPASPDAADREPSARTRANRAGARREAVESTRRRRAPRPAPRSRSGACGSARLGRLRLRERVLTVTGAAWQRAIVRRKRRRRDAAAADSSAKPGRVVRCRSSRAYRAPACPSRSRGGGRRNRLPRRRRGREPEQRLRYTLGASRRRARPGPESAFNVSEARRLWRDHAGKGVGLDVQHQRTRMKSPAGAELLLTRQPRRGPIARSCEREVERDGIACQASGATKSRGWQLEFEFVQAPNAR